MAGTMLLLYWLQDFPCNSSQNDNWVDLEANCLAMNVCKLFPLSAVTSFCSGLNWLFPGHHLLTFKNYLWWIVFRRQFILQDRICMTLPILSGFFFYLSNKEMFFLVLSRLIFTDNRTKDPFIVQRSQEQKWVACTPGVLSVNHSRMVLISNSSHPHWWIEGPFKLKLWFHTAPKNQHQSSVGLAKSDQPPVEWSLMVLLMCRLYRDHDSVFSGSKVFHHRSFTTLYLDLMWHIFTLLFCSFFSAVSYGSLWCLFFYWPFFPIPLLFFILSTELLSSGILWIELPFW